MFFEKGTDQRIWEQANHLSAYNIQGGFGSNCHWHESLALAYITKSTYYGEAKPGQQVDSNKLHQPDINLSNLNYFLYWKDCPSPVALTTIVFDSPDLTVFRKAAGNSIQTL